MKTRMTELLGIKHPVMQGGMQWLGVPELAAAVSNAGGLGTINASCYPEEDEFREAIRRTKELTDKPFAVNISLTPETTIGGQTAINIRIAGQEGVPVIETAGRSPEELRPIIQEAGMIHIHKCTSLKHALKAQTVGVDMVSVVGYEGAGHPGPDEIGCFILFQEVASHLDIPVLACGGTVDGKGLAAALAMGCEGVVMGTRFVASKECWVHENFKQVIVDATEKSTMTCQRSIKNMCRYYRNAQSAKALEVEEAGGGLDDILPIVSGKLGKECYASGDTEGSAFSIGESSALIEDVKSAREIVEDVVNGAQEIIRRLGEIPE